MIRKATCFPVPCHCGKSQNLEPILDYQALIQDYGYWAVLLGTFLEGETILLLGGVAAQMGALDVSLVMLTAFVGSTSGDQLYYFIGRWKGQALLDRFPRWQQSANKVGEHIKRHQNLIILSFRFFYGIRNVSPFVLGIYRISIPKFVSLNIIGAAVWAFTFTMIGFFLGEAHERILGKGSGLILFGILLLAGLIFWGYRRWFYRPVTSSPEDVDIPPP